MLLSSPHQIGTRGHQLSIEGGSTSGSAEGSGDPIAVRPARHLRNRYLLLLDAVTIPMATALAFVIRFEGTEWPAGASLVLAAYVALSLPIKLVALWRMGLYARLWRYASVLDFGSVVGGALVAAAGSAAISMLVIPLLTVPFDRVPLAVLVLDALLGAVVVAAPRSIVRIGIRRASRAPAVPRRRALIVGGGAAGSMILRELLSNPQLGLHPVAIVDDDRTKVGRRLHGVPVVGTLSDLDAVIPSQAIDEVIIAMPTAPGAVIRRVVQSAADAGRPTRTVPGLFELLDGRKSVSALRKVAIEDLLRREPVRTDLARVRKLAADKTVLVTGAGGSIGAELCRQIARLGPARLIAVGRGENSVFDLLHEVRQHFPELDIVPVITDIRDQARLEQVFRTHRPSTVFHAAAHKHVPLMEHNVSEAILNNVHGTGVVARLAAKYDAERFVLISSDKAVRPSSVMGATKRLSEGVLQQLTGRSRCRFVAVRFGNVLGSRGSVIPTFLRQIEAGGPVTITHPEMRRYFMTIPEAVQLVLQAGAMGEGGEVFVLDMGDPVRVVDLARDLIRLSGLLEGHDIEIRFTGIRPGEKLYEELLFDAEHATPTSHAKVLRAKNAALALDGEWTIEDLVERARRNASPDELRRIIHRLVPEYTGVPADYAPVQAPAAAAQAPSPAGAPSLPASSSAAGMGVRERVDVRAAVAEPSGRIAPVAT
jgi:FlaA1/EpsC-like NDP-sugar epimerase